MKSGATFSTDSNGKEMVDRVLNKRGPSYPSPYNISEPVAGNYYPVNAIAAIDDGDVEFAVVVDASLGGASLKSGSLEFMVHRRLQADDNRGVRGPARRTDAFFSKPEARAAGVLDRISRSQPRDSSRSRGVALRLWSFRGTIPRGSCRRSRSR